MVKRLTFIALLILVSTWAVVAQQATTGSVLTVGDPKARYRIEAFYDLQCGSCATFHQELKRVMDRFPEKVFVIFRHYPLAIHDQAFMASSAAEAARRQGKGLEMIDALLDGQSKWSASPRPFQVVLGYAIKLGLDRNRFTTDLRSDEVARTVVLDINRGKLLKVASTPTVYLNGKELPYAEALELEEIISKGN
jgi:protein-disulfide isomerase